MNDTDWQMVTKVWLIAMVDFQASKITMEEAFDRIGEYSEGVEDEVEQFACNVVSEIGGSPGGYAETITLLQRNPSKYEVLHFMDT